MCCKKKTKHKKRKKEEKNTGTWSQEVQKDQLKKNREERVSEVILGPCPN